MLLLREKAKIIAFILLSPSLSLVGCSNFRDSEFTDAKSIREFVEGGGDPDRKFLYEGNPKSEISLLHYSVWQNDLPLVKFLLDSGASPNSVDYNGRTPVMSIFALFHDIDERREVIDLLHPITDKNIVNFEGWDIYHLVREYWGEKWVNYLYSIE